MITSLDQLNPDGSYTYADYLLWQLQERIELIRGKIVRMSPAPSRRHQEAALALGATFYQFFRHQPCKVFVAPFDVRLPRKAQPGDKAYTVVQPDLCVVCDPAKLDDRGCEGAPDLVVEILSPGNTRREMREKFEVYEESGVREYWMVHLGDKTVQVFVLHEADGRFHGIKPFVDGDLMPAQIFPDLRIDLAEVFQS